MGGSCCLCILTDIPMKLLINPEAVINIVIMAYSLYHSQGFPSFPSILRYLISLIAVDLFALAKVIVLY